MAVNLDFHVFLYLVCSGACGLTPKISSWDSDCHRGQTFYFVLLEAVPTPAEGWG